MENKYVGFFRQIENVLLIYVKKLSSFRKTKSVVFLMVKMEGKMTAFIYQYLILKILVKETRKRS